MDFNGWLQIAVFAAIVVALTKPLGLYLYRVFEDEKRPLARLLVPIESLIYWLSGVDPLREQSWGQYALSVIVFSVVGIAVTFLIEVCQHLLPLNPQAMPSVEPILALNTAVSFATNTNWQSYVGETTMSYFTQMVGLAWHNFMSGAVGIGVAMALARGLTRAPERGGTLGNFWADLVRGTLYVLLPLSLVGALALVACGVIQNFSPYLAVQTLDGGAQTLAMGPVASQEAIKMIGTNGGGFFNANSAHPFENPTPLANLIEMVMIFAISGALTWTYGRMARDQKQGWVLFTAMGVLFLVGVAVAYTAESTDNPALRGLGIEQSAGNMEGKEVRFGVVNSALFATVTTDASCGAVNSMHDSFNPLGGLVPLVNIQLGEVIFGGVGSGLYGMLIFAVLSVFIAGLMVGRTPEFLGKKIEAREIKLAALYILIFPLLVLGFAGWSVVVPYGTSSLANQGPHGLSEILYAYTSAAGNNGSAFAGLSANTPWYNLSLAVGMFGGRFLMMLPVLAIAGSLAQKKIVAPGPGTFPTNGALFTALLIGVIVIIGALTFFPALSLGPILEHFAAGEGKVF